MDEIWEVIKSIGKKIKYNTEISNKGNVRIKAYYKGEEIKTYYLSLGQGLYIVPSYNYYNILIGNCSGDIYRYVYFMQYTGHQYIKGYQIHHIDYNHCNNSIDNLYYCSAKEHGLLHRWQGYLESEYSINKGIEIYGEQFINNLDNYNKATTLYKWLDSNKDIFTVANAKKYIKQLHIDTENYIKQQIEQQKIEKQKKREQDRIDKLNSGKYIEKDGKLVRVMSEYQKERMAEGRRRNCYNNPEWRKRVSERVKKFNNEHPELYSHRSPHKDKIGISKGAIRTYIDESELNHYIELGYHRGFN